MRNLNPDEIFDQVAMLNVVNEQIFARYVKGEGNVKVYAIVD